MAITVELQYGGVFGKCDASDWIEWEIDLDGEAEEAYFGDLFFCASRNFCRAFSKTCSLILAPSMIRATDLPVTSSCI